jgi:hypothetical protein
MSIIDCCTYYNELDLLTLRVETLRHVVDRFIVVEGDTTHSGQPKPYHLSDLRETGAWPFDVELYVCRVRLPRPEPNRWFPEGMQRNAIAAALLETLAQPDDQILISDVDEIPDPRNVQHQGGHRMRSQVYWLNAVFPQPWVGTVSYNYRIFLETTPTTLRFAGRAGRLPLVDGGWHFTYVGGTERIRQKIHAFAHQEFDRPEYLTELEAQAAALADPFGRPGHHNDGRIVAVDETFPEPLQREPQRWQHLLAPVPLLAPERKRLGDERVGSMTILESLALAAQHYQAGNPAPAGQLCREILHADPANAYALHLLGLLAHQARDWMEAFALYEEAIRLRPDLAEIHNSLAAARLEQGQLPEALNSLREALRLRPDYPEAHNNRGLACQRMGRLDEAQASFQEALRLRPDFADAWYNLRSTQSLQEKVERGQG